MHVAGWMPGCTSGSRRYADYDVTVAFRINTGAGGVASDAKDMVQALDAALADLATGIARVHGRQR